VLAILVLLLAPAAHAAPTPARDLARADSAYADGEANRARDLYARVVAADSTQSHAVFRLAQLTRDPLRALPLYRRYAALEPRDAWGAMALGDVLSRTGRTRAALREYGVAATLAPGERDIVSGRARVLARAGRVDEAAATLRQWLDRHPDDDELWRQLGRQVLAAGRPGQAIAAFARGHAPAEGGGDPAAIAGLRLAHVLRGPAIETATSQARDSDGNRVTTTSLTTDLLMRDAARLGLQLSRGDVAGSGGTATFNAAQLRLAARPLAIWRIEGGAGRTAIAFAGHSGDRVTGDVRSRWQWPEAGPRLELRADRRPLTANPQLVANGVTRTQAGAALDLPAGRFRVRGSIDAAEVAGAGESNFRRGMGGGVAMPVLSGWSTWLRYDRWGYRDASALGYFAPRLAEAVGFGSTLERDAGGPWLVDLDVRLGPQRFAAAGQPAGAWRIAGSAYAYASLRLGAGRELRLELETEGSPGFPVRPGPAADWRYSSVGASLRWALR